MKTATTKFFALCLCILFTFGTASANTATEIKLDEKNQVEYTVNPLAGTSIVAFGVKLPETGQVKINIIDNDGNVLHTFKQSKTEGFRNTFNLSSLEETSFVFQIVVNGKSYNESIRFVEKTPEKLNAYISDVDNDKIKLSFFEPQGKVYLKVKNEAGAIIYSGKLSTQSAYSGIVNLEDLSEGNYTIELDNGEKSFQKNVVIG